MFTGIIEAIGSVVGVRRHDGDVSVDVDTGKLDLGDVNIGDSIAVSGPCLTVVSIAGRVITFDISAETIAVTHFGELSLGERVNLERSVRIGAKLDGHLVSGHVDGLGEIIDLAPDGRSMQMTIEAPRDLAKFIAKKGSVTVDGISLTVNEVIDAKSNVRFSINVIPHTAKVTSLSTARIGRRVHLEVDMIARYLSRLAEVEADSDVATVPDICP